MRTAAFGAIALFLGALAARADFSYTTTSRATGGPMAAIAGNKTLTLKMYFRSQKIRSDNGFTANIIDFDAQTITMIDHRMKTAKVIKLSEATPLLPPMQSGIDVRETGQTQTIDGYSARELVLTVNMDMPMPQLGGSIMRNRNEVHVWLSSAVPGASELRDFYKKNMERIPWGAMAGGIPQTGQADAQMRRKIAEMAGVPVKTVTRVSTASIPATPQPGRPSPAGPSNLLLETTTDATGFSTAAIPDSVFAIPAGYRRQQTY